MAKSHIDIEIYFLKTQVYPYTVSKDNDFCVVFSTVLFKECLKEFEAGRVNVFPFSTEVLKEILKLLKHQIHNLLEPVESKILNIIEIIIRNMQL